MLNLITEFATAREAIDSAYSAQTKLGAYVVASLRAGMTLHSAARDYKAITERELQTFCYLLCTRAVDGRDGAVEFDRQAVANLVKVSLPAALAGTAFDGMRFRGGVDDVTDPSKKGFGKTSSWTKQEKRFLKKGAKNRELYRVAWIEATASSAVDPLKEIESISPVATFDAQDLQDMADDALDSKPRNTGVTGEPARFNPDWVSEHMVMASDAKAALTEMTNIAQEYWAETKRLEILVSQLTAQLASQTATKARSKASSKA